MGERVVALGLDAFDARGAVREDCQSASKFADQGSERGDKCIGLPMPIVAGEKQGVGSISGVAGGVQAVSSIGLVVVVVVGAGRRLGRYRMLE